jgi:hypothetical protein
LLQQLRRQLGRCEGASAEDAMMFSSGTAAIDQLLPGGGLRHGQLIEWLGGKWSRRAEEQGSSRVEQTNRGYSTTPLLHYCSTPRLHDSSSCAATLSLLSAREACREGGVLVVIDRSQTFYPPAAAAWGIDLERLIVVRPRSARDELWAAVESLRSPAVAAVWGVFDRLDNREFRRLQLAAQAGRTLGLLLRPAHVRGQPSWADVQFGVEGRGVRSEEKSDKRIEVRATRGVSRPPAFWLSILDSRLSTFRQVHVHVLRMRGGQTGGAAVLEIDDATHTVREVEKSFQLSALSRRPNLLANSR